jgi:hypothetical protein
MTKLNELAVPITSMEQVEEWKKTWDGKSAMPENISEFLLGNLQNVIDELHNVLVNTPGVRLLP